MTDFKRIKARIRVTNATTDMSTARQPLVGAFMVYTRYLNGSDSDVYIKERIGTTVAISKMDYVGRRNITQRTTGMTPGHSSGNFEYSDDSVPTYNEFMVTKSYVITSKYAREFFATANAYIDKIAEHDRNCENNKHDKENDPLYLLYMEYLHQYNKLPQDGNPAYSAETSTYNIALNYIFDISSLRIDNNGVKIKEINSDADFILGYNDHLDLVVSLNKDTGKYDHPLSTTALVDERANEIYKSIKGNVVIVEIVDNSKKCSAKYMRLGNSVIKITPVIDHSREDGVVISKYIYNNGIGILDGPPITCSFEEMEEKAGLYSTIEEAESLGNLDKNRDKIIDGLKEELTALKIKAALDKEKNALELAQVKTDAKEKEEMLTEKMRAREDYYDSRKKERSDYYEERSYVRKDSSEIVKWIPTIVGGVLGIAAIIYAKQK